MNSLSMSGIRGKATLLFVSFLAFSAALDGAEVRSNSSGGGKWSQTATWEENRVPGPEDTVVIAGGDKVLFDRDDSAVISCAALQLDPESRFEFEEGAGKRVFRVAGLLESYGAVRMDGTLSPEDHLEIQLVGGEEGKFALHRGGSLVISGHPALPEGRKNAAIRRTSAGEKTTAGSFAADSGCGIDIKHALFENVSAHFNSINNTGIRPNERLNVLDSRFENAAVTFTDCDTPHFARNQLTGEAGIEHGVLLLRTPMAVIKGNKIADYQTGIRANASEVTLDENTIEKVRTGIFATGSNVTVRGGAIRQAQTGILFQGIGGSIQDGSIEDSKTAIRCQSSKIQVSNMTLRLPEGGKESLALDVGQGSVTVLNSNIDPKAVKVTKGNATPATPPPVVSMQYLVAKVTGNTPPGAVVLVETENAAAPQAANMADLNIRNSPAPILPGGLTPLPRSMSAIIVKSWAMKWDGGLEPTPEYRLTVIVPPPGGEGAPKKYKSLKAKPDDKWHRPDLDSQAATLEISL